MVTRVWGSGGRPRKAVKLCSSALHWCSRACGGKSSSEYLEVVKRSAHCESFVTALQNLITCCVLSADDPKCSKAEPGVKDFLGNHCAGSPRWTPLKHEATDIQGQIEPLSERESTTLVTFDRRMWLVLQAGISQKPETSRDPLHWFSTLVQCTGQSINSISRGSQSI